MESSRSIRATAWPGRQVAVGDVRADLPPYSFVVQFNQQTGTTLKGTIMHPVTATVIGAAELVPKMGFKF